MKDDAFSKYDGMKYDDIFKILIKRIDDLEFDCRRTDLRCDTLEKRCVGLSGEIVVLKRRNGLI